jgi:hypothetical protein
MGERRHVYSNRDPTFNIIADRADNSLLSHGWIKDKPRFITSDTGAFVTIARPDVASELPERTPNRRYTLQTA